eukprot:scaffold1009_cov173-Pinguiococcus_pyrenoidosus.AAC.1
MSKSHPGETHLKVWLAFFPRGASRVSDHADVPQLVVPKEIPGVVVQGSPVFALIRINAEVQEASNRVLQAVREEAPSSSLRFCELALFTRT